MKKQSQASASSGGSAADRTTGRGGKQSVSRSNAASEGENIRNSRRISETQKSKLEEKGPGTGLGGDRKRR